MIQGGGHTGFAQESLAGRGGHESGFQRLERDGTAQAHIPGLEDFTHAAFADPFKHLEMANFLSDRYWVHKKVVVTRSGAQALDHDLLPPDHVARRDCAK